MSKPKYMKGDCIRSLDDLVLQENIFWNGRIWNRKWFMNLRNGGYMIDAKEIVQALRCCAEGECKDCAMHEDKQRCQENLLDKASEAIERLTAENADLGKEIEWKDMVIALAQREQAKAEAERDALLEIAKNGKDCDTCKNCAVCVKPGTDVAHWCDRCEEKCRCYGCGGDHWEWRGLPEEPEGGEKA